MNKRVFLHIEEPELSLDPSAQRSLLNSIIKELAYRHDDGRDLNLMIPMFCLKNNIIFSLFFLTY